MKSAVGSFFDGVAFCITVLVLSLAFFKGLLWLADNVPHFGRILFVTVDFVGASLVLWRGYAWYRRTRA